MSLGDSNLLNRLEITVQKPKLASVQLWVIKKLLARDFKDGVYYHFCAYFLPICPFCELMRVLLVSIGSNHVFSRGFRLEKNAMHCFVICILKLSTNTVDKLF